MTIPVDFNLLFTDPQKFMTIRKLSESNGDGGVGGGKAGGGSVSGGGVGVGSGRRGTERNTGVEEYLAKQQEAEQKALAAKQLGDQYESSSNVLLNGGGVSLPPSQASMVLGPQGGGNYAPMTKTLFAAGKADSAIKLMDYSRQRDNEQAYGQAYDKGGIPSMIQTMVHRDPERAIQLMDSFGKQTDRYMNQPKLKAETDETKIKVAIAQAKAVAPFRAAIHSEELRGGPQAAAALHARLQPEMDKIAPGLIEKTYNKNTNDAGLLMAISGGGGIGGSGGEGASGAGSSPTTGSAGGPGQITVAGTTFGKPTKAFDVPSGYMVDPKDPNRVTPIPGTKEQSTDRKYDQAQNIGYDAAVRARDTYFVDKEHKIINPEVRKGMAAAGIGMDIPFTDMHLGVQPGTQEAARWNKDFNMAIEAYQGVQGTRLTPRQIKSFESSMKPTYDDSNETAKYKLDGLVALHDPETQKKITEGIKNGLEPDQAVMVARPAPDTVAHPDGRNFTEEEISSIAKRDNLSPDDVKKIIYTNNELIRQKQLIEEKANSTEGKFGDIAAGIYKGTIGTPDGPDTSYNKQLNTIGPAPTADQYPGKDLDIQQALQRRKQIDDMMQINNNTLNAPTAPESMPPQGQTSGAELTPRAQELLYGPQQSVGPVAPQEVQPVQEQQPNQVDPDIEERMRIWRLRHGY